MPFNLGPGELLLILAIALVVLGPKKLPEAGRSLGRGLREFKNSVSSMSISDDDDEKPSLKARNGESAST